MRGTIFKVYKRKSCFNAHGFYFMCICWSDNYYPLMFKDRQVKSTTSSIEYFSKLGLISTSICIKIFSWFDYSLNMIVDRSCKYSKQFWFKFIIIISAQTIKGNIFREIYIPWINQLYTYVPLDQLQISVFITRMSICF